MQEFLETLSAGRYQDAKKQDPQVLLQILICSSKLEYVGLMLLRRPGGKFCVSVFRQNQEYHVINVHDGAYSPWLQLSRKVGTVCAPIRRECRHSLPGILIQGDQPALRSANMISNWLSTMSQFWHRACQCFTIRWDARYSIRRRESSLVKEGLFLVICRN